MKIAGQTVSRCFRFCFASKRKVCNKISVIFCTNVHHNSDQKTSYVPVVTLCVWWWEQQRSAGVVHGGAHVLLTDLHMRLDKRWGFIQAYSQRSWVIEYCFSRCKLLYLTVGRFMIRLLNFF